MPENNSIALKSLTRADRNAAELRSYALAVICLSAALATRMALDRLWGDRLPYVGFFLAELLVMRFAGPGPLAFTTIVGFILADWFFVSPRHSFLIDGVVNQLNAGFFALFSCILFLFSVRERRALIRERVAQNQLQQNAKELARLAAIVESSDDAIISKALDGTVLSWNAAAERLYGYTAAEAIGKSIGILIPSTLREEFDLLLDKVRRGERISHFETVRQTRDGRTITVSLAVSPVHDSTGQLVGASTIARDISERKLAEAERERLVHDLQAALANVKTLRGLLPICASCKKIRDDKGYWNQIEFYIRERSDASFTHGICPECAEKLYGDVMKPVDSPDKT